MTGGDVICFVPVGVGGVTGICPPATGSSGQMEETDLEPTRG